KSTAAAASTATDAPISANSGIPPLDQFLGLDSRFLNGPAGGSALTNQILYASSGQEVPTDFLRYGYYDGLSSRKGFRGLLNTYRFDTQQFAAIGIDAILDLDKKLKAGLPSNTKAPSTAPVASTTKVADKTTADATSPTPPKTSQTDDFGKLSTDTL